MKIGIVGMGWVGSSVAISVLQSGVASEVLVCDAKRELAQGEAMDLAHGAAFYPAAQVRAVELDELYVTTARDGLSDAEVAAQPLAGAIFRLETGSLGRPAAPFAG